MIPILSKKPSLPKELQDTVSKLDIVSSLLLMGLLLDHALQLCGLQKKAK